MYIQKLELENLRSFQKADVNFSRNINIITGHNNSGKSTIIKALYKLQDLHSLSKDDIRAGKQFSEIAIDLAGIDTESNNKYFHHKHPLREQEEARIKFKITNQTQENKFIQKKSGITIPFEAPYHVDNFETRDFFGFANLENEFNPIYPFFSKRKLNRYSSSAANNLTYTVLDNLQNLPEKIQKTSGQQITKNKFEELCNDILGFQIADKLENNELRLGVYSGYGFFIPLESMGEGVANILGLITILLTEDNRIFLIEELENDIHPLALKKLLNFIIEKSEKNQFIISTHSNIVLKYLGSLSTSKIFYTEYDPIGHSGFNIPTSTISEISNAPHERRKILEMLGYDLFDYDIYKAYLIFEESSAEQIIRDFIIPIFYPDVKGKLRTIAAQGVSDLDPKFNDLQRLFMYLHTAEIYEGKAWVIADGDEAGKEAINMLYEKFKLTWTKSHFLNFEKSNFEFYYPNHFQQEVNEILGMPQQIEKRKRKELLLRKVIEWYNENADQVKSSLQNSASEVIEKIGKIVEIID